MAEIRFYRILLGLVLPLMWAGSAHAFSPSRMMVADFETTDPSAVKCSQDVNVSAPVVLAGSNAIDGSRSLKFSANLSGLNAGWAGCSLPLKDAASVTTGADAIVFDAKSLRPNGGLFVTLTESDGSRWNANVRLTEAWSHCRVPFGSFEPFTSAKGREGTRPLVQKIVSIDPWVGNWLTGVNGFEIDNVAIVDDQPTFLLRCASETSVPLQKSTVLALEACETTGGPVSAFNGELWLDVLNRDEMNFPEKVVMKNGRASAEIFARRPGPIDLFVYEPESRTQSVINLNVRDGLRTELSFDGFEGEQLVFANQTLVPKLKLQGSGQLPLTIHITAKDHNGGVVVSQFESVSALVEGKGRVAIPSVGLVTVEVRALAQPLASFPHVESDLPVPVAKAEESTAPLDALPDGVTTSLVTGAIVTLESLPTTATVVGEDRFTAWAIAVSPSEMILYNSPFAICSGALFHLSLNEMVTIGKRRLNWHRKLGSFWGRNDIWWDQTEPYKGVFNWEKAGMVVNSYKEEHLTLLGVLCYAAKWADGAAPSNEDGRKEWREWVAEFLKQYPRTFKAFEVWNEPNHGNWKPRPDPDAYRELVKTTFGGVRRAQSQARIVAGATAGFDPPFLEHLMEDGYGSYWDAISMHPYPEAPGRSPEENCFPEACIGLRELARKHDLLSKERWITEVGWPSGPFGVSEMEQANYLVRAYTIARSHDIGKIFWFDLCDWTRMPWTGESGAHNGLIDSNFRPKPAALAYNLMLFMLNQCTAGDMIKQGKATIYPFDARTQSVKWPGKVYVAWTPISGDEEDIELTLVAGGAYYAFDYLGAEQKPKVLSEVPMKIESKETTSTHEAGSEEHEHHEKAEKIPMKRTCRFHVTNEPLYIWDSIIPPKPHFHNEPPH